MTKEQIKKYLLAFGLDNKAADYYAGLEEEGKYAWFSALRFLRPLNNSLSYYEKEYAEILKDRLKNGLENTDAENEMLSKGVSPEMIGKFARQIAQTAFFEVLYRLSDPAGDDYDLVNEGADLPAWTLMERDPDYKNTGKMVAEMHNLLPFSNL